MVWEKEKNKQELTDEESEWITHCRQRTWANFNSRRGEPDWSMVSDELLEDLDDLNKVWEESEGRLVFVKDDKDVVQYWTDVREVIETHVVETMNPSSEKGKVVATHILMKLDWYSSQAGLEWNRVRIPLLTPRLVDALAANITAAAKSYEEVRKLINPIISLSALG